MAQTTIDNDYIAGRFDLLAKLMDIHGENSFKTRSYSTAAFTLEKLPMSLDGLPLEKITSIKGIGDAIGKKIQEIQTTGELKLLRDYIANTPAGVVEMLAIKGLGPKKIATIWKDMEIESIGELLYACQENRLLLFKGFGEKTQQNVRDAIEFRLKHQDSFLFAEIEQYAARVQALLEKTFPNDRHSPTGDLRRQLEVIEKLEWVTTIGVDAAVSCLQNEGFTVEPGEYAPITRYRNPDGIGIELRHTSAETFANVLFGTSCSREFLDAWTQKTGWNLATDYPDEVVIFQTHNIHYVPAFLREQGSILDRAANGPLDELIQPTDIKAIIHSHSTWSDGSNTLEEMAKACIEKGFEYLVISDHSKSAFYANGLKEDRIKEQHAQIAELNARLAPFTIFKSIECDILTDGGLDYSNDVLSTFDLVITSIHSNLKMSEEKAMARLLKAIENPYTTILGHLTGRLLLSRPGYPVDHKRIIDACVSNKVVIELNAHPRRLDMDWRWIAYALDQGALISIDPDSHSVNGYKDIRYGVLAAQKAGLTPKQNLSSFPLDTFKKFLADRKQAKNG